MLEEEAESALHSSGKILKAGSSKGWEEGGNTTAYGGMCWLTGSRVELDDQQQGVIPSQKDGKCKYHGNIQNWCEITEWPGSEAPFIISLLVSQEQHMLLVSIQNRVEQTISVPARVGTRAIW